MQVDCPQCSMLSGLLFILFINDIFLLVIPNIGIFPYANNTAIIITADNEVYLQLFSSDFKKILILVS